jgi:hypothetical protein
MAFAEWAQNNEVSFNNVWFSDEAHFHLDGVVNKQNARFLVAENPCVIRKNVHHAPRITVWVAISSHGLLGPILFEETVNSERYYSLVQHDGARLHIVNVVLDFLHDTFNSCVISNRFPDHFACGQNWPQNSPDLNPCDYFLWGFLKEKIFPKS